MRDNVSYNRQLVRKLQNSNLTLAEIEIAGTASSYFHNADKNVAALKQNPAILIF